MDADIKAFILRALLAAKDQPMTDAILRQAIRNAFAHVSFTVSEITGYIKDVEESGFISGATDSVFGLMWDLTPKGKIKAQQLR